MLIEHHTYYYNGSDQTAYERRMHTLRYVTYYITEEVYNCCLTGHLAIGIVYYKNQVSFTANI